ncbi:MAG: PilN domain-containing protein [Gemmatimonadota bacterium]
MVRINLVPGDRQGRPRARAAAATSRPRLEGVPRSPVVLGGLAGLIVLLLLVFFYFAERRALGEARAAVVEAQADSAALHDAVLRVRMMEETQSRLAVRVDLMETVIEGRLYWIRFMETLSRFLPEYTWLELVDQEELGPEQIRIAGGTFSNAAVTDYMRGLEASPLLERVTLVGVSRVEKDDVAYQQFTMVANFEEYQAVVIAVPADTTEAEE